MVVAGTRYYLGTDFNRAQLADWTGSKERLKRAEKSNAAFCFETLLFDVCVAYKMESRGFFGPPCSDDPSQAEVWGVGGGSVVMENDRNPSSRVERSPAAETASRKTTDGIQRRSGGLFVMVQRRRLEESPLHSVCSPVWFPAPTFRRVRTNPIPPRPSTSR